jgi:hypothetical protein
MIKRHMYSYVSPFDPVRWAMLLLAVLVCTPAVMMITINVRCVIWFRPECMDLNRLQNFREWLAETLPVLVAIIMMRQKL